MLRIRLASNVALLRAPMQIAGLYRFSLRLGTVNLLQHRVINIVAEHGINGVRYGRWPSLVSCTRLASATLRSSTKRNALSVLRWPTSQLTRILSQRRLPSMSKHRPRRPGHSWHASRCHFSRKRNSRFHPSGYAETLRFRTCLIMVGRASVTGIRPQV